MDLKQEIREIAKDALKYSTKQRLNDLADQIEAEEKANNAQNGDNQK